MNINMQHDANHELDFLREIKDVMHNLDFHKLRKLIRNHLILDLKKVRIFRLFRLRDLKLSEPFCRQYIRPKAQRGITLFEPYSISSFTI